MTAMSQTVQHLAGFGARPVLWRQNESVASDFTV